MTNYMVSKSPSINVFPEHRLNAVNRLIYSGFTEHMARCIYGGIYDPENPNKDLINDDGFRLDVIEALKPLQIPVFRYPGGNFCATYHWEDGIGPRENRPVVSELAWGGIETNQVGTDEFMKWCKLLDAEPYLCLNMGTGSLKDALNWIEYCNGTRNTKYANLRRANGHTEPYKVKYWALGNETWGPWQVNQLTAEEYAERAYQWAKAIKLLDPSVILILCGKEGATSWDYKVIAHCIREASKTDLGEYRPPLIDMHSIHLYTSSYDHYENVTAPLTAERAIEVAKALIDIPYYESGVPASQPRPLICFDEWNVWKPTRAVGSEGGEESYTLSDALAVAVWLNIFIRKSQDVGMANIAQSVNVLSPLMTSKEGIIKQTTWFVYELFCKYMKGEHIATHLACEEYTGKTSTSFCRATRRTPYLDISATYDDEQGFVNLAVVNMHKEQDLDVKLAGLSATDGGATKVQVYEVNGEVVGVTNMPPDDKKPKDVAAEGEDNVAVYDKGKVSTKEKEVEIKGSYTFPKHSFTLLRWKA